MKRKQIFQIVILLTLGLIFYSCASAGNFAYMKSELDRAILNGKIFDERGLPLEGADVSLDDIFTTKSDINGRFLFNYLALGEHTVTIKKDGYTEKVFTFNHKLRDRIKERKKPLVLRAKLFSYNYLLTEGMFLLQDEQYEGVEEILTKLEEINNEDEAYLYLKAAYYKNIQKNDEALTILKQLVELNRNNAYYYLTLIDLFNELEEYEQEALTCLSLARRKSDYLEYMEKAALIYKVRLNDSETHDKLLEEYAKLQELEKGYDTP